MTTDACRALAWFQNSAQHPDHRCFSRTVRTEKAEDRSFSNSKRNMIDSGEIAESLRQPFHFDHRLSHREQLGKTRRWIGLSPSRWLRPVTTRSGQRIPP